MKQLQRIDLRRQFDPEDVTAGWSGDFRARRKIFCDGLRDPRHLFGVEAPQLAEVVIVAPVRQKFSDGHLRERGGADAADEFQMLHLGSKATGSSPADARARRERFRE